MDIISTLDRYEPRSLHHEVPVVWDMAYDWTVIDRDKKEYIDFTSGIFVANIGHGRVFDAMDEISLLHSYVFPTEIRAELVKKICDMTGFEKVFLCTTGSEAVEAALRIMGNDTDYILSLKGCNHGRTLGSRLLQDGFLEYNLRPGDHKWYNIDGIIFETYFGYNARFHPVEWVQEWCNWAKENNIPVCFDEVQAGFGRTGKLFGYEHYGVKPDLVVIGKAFGGGMPISGVLGSAELLDRPDDLSSTHTGNPVCCAAALTTLEVLEKENLIERAANMEPVFVEELGKMLYPYYGRGMIWGIDLEDVGRANQIVDKCAEKGLLLVKTHRGTIKIGPPLVMPREVVIEGMEILREVCKSVMLVS